MPDSLEKEGAKAFFSGDSSECVSLLNRKRWRCRWWWWRWRRWWLIRGTALPNIVSHWGRSLANNAVWRQVKRGTSLKGKLITERSYALFPSIGCVDASAGGGFWVNKRKKLSGEAEKTLAWDKKKGGLLHDPLRLHSCWGWIRLDCVGKCIRACRMSVSAVIGWIGKKREVLFCLHPQ